jgi:hypothetical protein
MKYAAVGFLFVLRNVLLDELEVVSTCQIPEQLSKCAKGMAPILGSA